MHHCFFLKKEKNHRRLEVTLQPPFFYHSDLMDLIEKQLSELASSMKRAALTPCLNGTKNSPLSH